MRYFETDGRKCTWCNQRIGMKDFVRICSHELFFGDLMHSRCTHKVEWAMSGIEIYLKIWKRIVGNEMCRTVCRKLNI